MKSFQLTALAWIALLVLGASSWGQAGDTFSINVRNAEIGDFIEQVQEIVGKTIVIDPDIKRQSITVLSGTTLDRETVYKVFLVAMRAHGLAVVESDGIVRIVPTQDIRDQPSTSERIADPEQIITRVIQLYNIPASEAFKVFRNLMPEYAFIHFVEHSNVLVLSNHKDKLDEMEEIVRRMDTPIETTFSVIKLEHAWVGDILDILDQMDLGKRAAQIPGSRQILVLANTRNNSLIIVGHKLQVAEISQLVSELDSERTSDKVTKIIKLHNAKAEETAKIIVSILQEGSDAGAELDTKGRITITFDPSLNALVLHGLPQRIQEIEDLIRQLDAPRGQVLIEAAVVEITLDDDTSIGVEVAGGDEDGSSVPVINTTLTGIISSVLGGLDDPEDVTVTGLAASATSPTLAVAKINPDGLSFGAIIQALTTQKRANLLMSPYVTVQDNVQARLVAGQTVPFRSTTPTVPTGQQQPYFPVGQNINREDVGITLQVTPNIYNDVSVKMEVSQEVSNIATPEIGIGDTGLSDVVTNKRLITTTVVAQNGQTIVLGGLLQDDIKRSVTRVPGISHIPLIGNLFKRQDTTYNKLLLLVFLRPTILVTSDDVSAMAKRKFDQFRTLVIESDKAHTLPENVDGLYEGRP